MEKLKIALLAGGDSPEREIALQSAAQIAAALDRGKYDVTVIDLHRRDWHYTAPDGRQWQVDKNDFSLTVEGERREFDYALVIIHGTPGEDGRLQGYLDMMGVPYSSCSMTSSVITFDKVTTKRTVAGRGINLAREIFLCKGETADPDEVIAEFGLPLFHQAKRQRQFVRRDEGPHARRGAARRRSGFRPERRSADRRVHRRPRNGLRHDGGGGPGSICSRSRRSSPRRTSSTIRPNTPKGIRTR